MQLFRVEIELSPVEACRATKAAIRRFRIDIDGPPTAKPHYGDAGSGWPHYYARFQLWEPKYFVDLSADGRELRSRVDTQFHILGDLPINWIEKQLKNGNKYYLKLLWQPPQYLEIPPLWPGQYLVRCYLAGKPMGKGPLCAPLETALSVSKAPGTMQTAPTFPLHVSNIRTIIPHIYATQINSSVGSIPFDLKELGLPIIRSGFDTQHLDDSQKRLKQLTTILGKYVQTERINKQMFAPIIRLNADYQTMDRSKNNLMAALLSTNDSQIKSRSTVKMGEGTFKSALSFMKKDPETSKNQFHQSYQFALQALLLDPNNVRAYLLGARANFHIDRVQSGYDFMITMIGRLLFFEKILSSDQVPLAISYLIQHLVDFYLDSAMLKQYQESVEMLGLAKYNLKSFPHLNKRVG